MAARGYRDYDGSEDEFDTALPPNEQSEDDDDDSEWALFSSSSPSSSPMAVAGPTLPPNVSTSKPAPIPPSSPDCSMDADSSSDGEEAASAPRRSSTPVSQFTSPQARIVQQRRVTIKELESKYRQECLALCRTLVHFQQKWRKELETSIHGLSSFRNLKPEAAVNQKEVSGLRLETQIEKSGVSKYRSGTSSAAMSNFKSMPGIGF